MAIAAAGAGHALAEDVYFFRSQSNLLGQEKQTSFSFAINGQVGVAISSDLGKRYPGYGFAISSGSLPVDVHFDPATGLISGIPTSAGDFAVVLAGTSDGKSISVTAKLKIDAAPVAPAIPTPDIADQGKTILGVSGLSVGAWKPSAATGWKSAVVQKGKGEPWNRPDTVFTPSQDLGRYGLSFDTTNGTITGTPSEPFIIRDFRITVTSKEGFADTTAPFWIGVAPSTPLRVSSSQDDVYVFRLGKAFSTSPILVDGAFGNLEFTQPNGIPSGWDARTGVWAQDGTKQTPESVSHPVSQTTTISDEFGRSTTWSFISDFAHPLEVKNSEVTVYYDDTYTDDKPLASLQSAGLLGAATWTASNLPIGLHLDQASGKISGAISTTSLYKDGQKFEMPLTLKDSYDGSEAAGSATIIAKIKETVNIAMQVTAGDRHVCALKPDGSAWCWGRNSSGQVGNGTTTSSVLTPVQVAGLSSGVAAISAGNIQTCALKTDRSVWCWGGSYGNSPVVVEAAAASRSISAFGDRICSVKIDGTVWCWAVGTAPAQVPGISDVQSVATGVGYSCAVTADQNVWCWGSGASGVLGNGSTAAKSTPTLVQGLPANGSGVVKLDAGWTHTCAIARDAQAYCWGANDRGQLGIGNNVAQLTAVKMANVGPASRISLGYKYTCLALKSGAAACVGFGENGKLGSGNTADANLPITPVGLETNVVDVAIGGAQSLAMKRDASLAVWGRGSSGELGLGGTGDKAVPTPLNFGQ